MTRGLVISAPQSGAGKTLVALGLARALADAGLRVAPAKCGPDYIDPAFLALAARRGCVSLDPWGMRRKRLGALAAGRAGDADLLLVEGVMGLFDGSAAGPGSTGDLAAILDLPVVLVVDCARMAQSVAAVVAGFLHFRDDVRIAAVILNRVGSDTHEIMMREAMQRVGIPVLGALRRDEALAVPERHLGLVLPGEVAGVEALVARAAGAVARDIDLDAVLDAAEPVSPAGHAGRLPPLGQRIAVARDAAFAFMYEHWIEDWRLGGAELMEFSPLADEPPPAGADAVLLPGGYPELHGARLAAAETFRTGLHAARDRGALIYGECGGYMVLGRTLTDAQGATHRMAGLLPVETRIDRPRRVLGYRLLRHHGPLPFARALSGHEFHYSSEAKGDGPGLFVAVTDARGRRMPPLGLAVGRVCGSYAHVIDAAPEAAA